VIDGDLLALVSVLGGVEVINPFRRL